MRKLPVYFLIDVSESMAGEPIEEVEKGFHEIIKILRDDPYALETVWIAVLIFAGRAETLTPLTELVDFQPPSFPVGGGTDLGAGLELLMRDIDRNVMKTTAQKKGDWKPIIFLFTDGAPVCNPEKAVNKWVKDYKSSVNLVAVAFGDHADVPLLEKIAGVVLTLKDTSGESFKEFFKWVTASIQISSMAVSETGDDSPRLSERGINLKKAEPSANLDERYAVLLVKCSKTGKLALAKYERGSPRYTLIGSYPVDEARYSALSLRGADAAHINVSLIDRTPTCPHCAEGDSFVLCNKCGNLFCSSGERKVVCPWCGKKGEVVYSNDFNISRGQG